MVELMLQPNPFLECSKVQGTPLLFYTAFPVSPGQVTENGRPEASGFTMSQEHLKQKWTRVWVKSEICR